MSTWGLRSRARAGRWTLATLVLALIARVGVVLVSPHYKPVFDAADYNRHAGSIAATGKFPVSWLDPNGGPTAFRPPLYPFLLGAIYAIVGVGHGVTWGRLAGAALGTATVWLIGGVARELWGEAARRRAMLFAAIWPPLMLLDAALMTEELFLTLEVAVVLSALLARSHEKPLLWATLCGVCCGLATLTRSNGVLLALLAAAGTWTLRPRFSARGMAAPAVVLAATALTILPWTIRNAVVLHQIVPVDTQTGYALSGYFNDQSRTLPGYMGLWLAPQGTRRYAPIFNRHPQNEAQLDDALRSSAIRYAVGHPGYVFEGAALNFVRMLDFAPNPPGAAKLDRIQLGLSTESAEIVQWTFVLGLVAAAVGALRLRKRQSRSRVPAFVWGVPITMLLAAAWLIGVTRYRAPSYPFIALLAGFALTHLPGEQSLHEHKREHRII